MQKQLWVIINPEFMTLAESSLRVGGKFCTLGSEQSRVSRFPRVKFAYGRKRSDFFPRCVRREDHDRRTQTQARGQRSGRKFVEKESCLKSLSGARLASNFQWFTKRRAEVRGDIATAEFTSNMAGAARVRCSRLQPVVSSRPLLAVKILPNPAQSLILKVEFLLSSFLCFRVFQCLCIEKNPVNQIQISAADCKSNW